MAREGDRSTETLRNVELVPGFHGWAEGSCLYSSGKTRVLCTASIDAGVPSFLVGKGKGWLTAEYQMHPRANPQRREQRDGRGKAPSGRTQEIQRLIGRALRASLDLDALGERTVALDCDVLEADGGTRTASITGSFVALALALHKLTARGDLAAKILVDQVAAVSVGHHDDSVLLDLDYAEDSRARVDLNVVATPAGDVIELQGTAEGRAVPRATFDRMIDLGLAGIATLATKQRAALTAAGVDLDALLRQLEPAMRVLLATTNRGKLRELQSLLGATDVTIVTPDEAGVGHLEVIEDGATFEANAVKKALEFAAASGLPSLADDSGLEVDALDGRPGVYSARFAGEHATDDENKALLLTSLANVSDRKARFRCVLAFVTSASAPPVIVEGTCDGAITEAPRGSGGFGYDPLFLVDGAGGRTLAELEPAEKNAVSHRGKALRQIVPLLTSSPLLPRPSFG